MTLEYVSDHESKPQKKQRSSVASVSEGAPIKDKIKLQQSSVASVSKGAPIIPKETQIETVVDEVKQEVKQEVKKKERSQNQIDATNKMREALRLRRESNLKIKETAKLEHEELNKKIKKKLHKNKINEEVQKKLKEIVQSSSEEESDEEESEEEIVVKKHKAKSLPPRSAPPTPKYQPYRNNLKVDFF